MSGIKILFVEDDSRELQPCRDSVERYRREQARQVEIVECKSLEQASSEVDNTFDGAIVDLRLGRDDDAGNQLIKKIEEELLRIPVIVLTGTPESADRTNTSVIKVAKKGDEGSDYYSLVDQFWSIHETGLTRILGGRGLIESKLSVVFRKNLLPQINRWQEYGSQDSGRTERALLRHVLNHLIPLVDDDDDQWFPEEFYLHPPPDESIRTGSLLDEKNGGRRFAVLNPSCDLVMRKNAPNTDKALLVEVICPERILDWFDETELDNLSNNRKNILLDLLNNKRAAYYHCLPQTRFYSLGFLNFRYLTTLTFDELSERFKIPPRVQIAAPFVRDIVARFSTYYARQGQPELNFANLITS